MRKAIGTGSCQLIFYLSVIGMSFWTCSFSLRPPTILFVYRMTCFLNALFPQGSLEQALAMQNLSDQKNAALLLISTLFFVRTSRIWNALPLQLRYEHVTLNQFKSLLSSCYKDALISRFDIEEPSTWKSVWLKCNTLRNLSEPVSCCY